MTIQPLFLLGGHDLEMKAIAKLLTSNHVPYLDANLSWDNALWEAYLQPPYKAQLEAALAQVQPLYGIELRGSIPDGCQLIDHHNKQEDQPSSIDQVSKIIGHTMTRWEELVAANDTGYIPALMQMGASDEEIEKVRRADRQAQGVTEEDEELALKSIGEHMEVSPDELIVVRSLTSRFSPITDRLYGQANRLLVYHDRDLNYYGEGKEKLVSHFDDLLKADNAYHGGGSSGFFGIHSIENDQHMQELIADIKRLTNA